MFSNGISVLQTPKNGIYTHQCSETTKIWNLGLLSFNALLKNHIYFFKTLYFWFDIIETPFPAKLFAFLFCALKHSSEKSYKVKKLFKG